MCQDCNDALKTAAEAALSLAQAASDLYAIKEYPAARRLAQAAADLFPEEPQAQTAQPEAEAGKPEGNSEGTATQGFAIDPVTGEMFFNGALIGRAVAIRKRTPQ